STLASQLAMLHAATRVRLPVRYVELGNELYDPRYAELFAGGAEYGRLANRWIPALKAAFPGVKVAVVGDAGPDPNQPDASARARALAWNRSLLATVHGE